MAKTIISATWECWARSFSTAFPAKVVICSVNKRDKAEVLNHLQAYDGGN